MMDTLNGLQVKGLAVFGVCDKQLACHSCRVNVKRGRGLFPPAEEEETDVLVELGSRFIPG